MLFTLWANGRSVCGGVAKFASVQRRGCLLFNLAKRLTHIFKYFVLVACVYLWQLHAQGFQAKTCRVWISHGFVFEEPATNRFVWLIGRSPVAVWDHPLPTKSRQARFLVIMTARSVFFVVLIAVMDSGVVTPTETDALFSRAGEWNPPLCLSTAHSVRRGWATAFQSETLLFWRPLESAYRCREFRLKCALIHAVCRRPRLSLL